MSAVIRRECDNDVYNALVDDLVEVEVVENAFEKFYNEVETPIIPVSTPLDVKVRLAKSLMMQIEKNLAYRLGHKEFVWVDFPKRLPKDVVEAIKMIYEDQDWHVSPRLFTNPKRDPRTNKKIFGNIILCVNPIPETGKMPWSRNEEDFDIDFENDKDPISYL